MTEHYFLANPDFARFFQPPFHFNPDLVEAAEGENVLDAIIDVTLQEGARI